MRETKTVQLEYDDGTIGQYEFDEQEVTDLTSAALYGSGWFRFKDGKATMLVNLRHVLNARVMPHE